MIPSGFSFPDGLKIGQIADEIILFFDDPERFKDQRQQLFSDAAQAIEGMLQTFTIIEETDVDLQNPLDIHRYWIITSSLSKIYQEDTFPFRDINRDRLRILIEYCHLLSQSYNIGYYDSINLRNFFINLSISIDPQHQRALTWK
jgi:hypothetical protein